MSRCSASPYWSVFLLAHSAMYAFLIFPSSEPKTLSTQRRHIRYEQKKMDEGGAFVNLAPLEKRFHKLGGLYAEAFKKGM